MYTASPTGNFRTDTRYHDQVPDQPKTPHRTFRADDELWAEFSAAAEAAGLDVSAVLRGFMGWYVRRPKAPKPRQPARPTEAQVEAWKAKRAQRSRRAQPPTVRNEAQEPR